MHLHSRRSFVTLGKTPKNTIKECEACYNSRCFGAQVSSQSLKIGSILITYLSRVCGDNLPLMISIQIFEFGRLMNL
jgi:hypothetical protein